VNGDRSGGPRRDPGLDRKNIRLAIALGLVALGIYVVFFLKYALT
jgi:hypothetical protein